MRQVGRRVCLIDYSCIEDSPTLLTVGCLSVTQPWTKCSNLGRPSGWLATLPLEVASDYCCDFMRFNYYSNQIAKFSNQIANWISVSNQIFSSQIKSAKWFKSRFKSQQRLGFANHCYLLRQLPTYLQRGPTQGSTHFYYHVKRKHKSTN